MKNKKILSTVLCLLMIISMAACAQTETSNTNNPTVNIGNITNNPIDDIVDDLTVPTEWENNYPENDIPTDNTENSTIVVTEPEVSDTTTYSTAITMLDVGQGLSVLVESNGEYMLYDGGGRNYSSYVVAYLQQHNITELKYMFTSHYDEDHINGQVGVLNTVPIDLVVRPDYVHNSKLYQSYLDMLNKNGAPSEYPGVGDTYTLGNATITVLAPNAYGDDANENSIAININDGAFNCVITGDAEQESEKNMIDSGLLPDCDVYVVGHHGSSSSSSKSFIKAISPEYAFISVGAGNSYGHPTKKTMDTLLSNNIQIYRSDLQGAVTCYSNGIDYWFSEEASNDYASGDNVAIVNEDENIVDIPESTANYVLNTNSMKFHYPDCQYAKQISDKNRQNTVESRENLIKQGYSACGSCKP